MGEKVGFTNCVFEMLCFFFWKHYFYSVFSKTQLFKNKNCMLKKTRKFMKNCGLFLNMAKWCFLGLFFFEVLRLLWFVFGVFGIVPKVLKMLVFPSFWGFCGVAYSSIFWVWEGLGVFVFLVFVFVFCVAFVSVLFALFLFCCWIVFGVGSCFALVFCFFLFFFVFFVFSVFFFLLFFCFQVGPKGHLTFPYVFAFFCLFCFLFFGRV